MTQKIEGVGRSVRRTSLLATSVLLLWSCSDGTSDPGAGSTRTLDAVQGDAQSAPVANMVPVTPTVVVRDGAGRGVPDVDVTFSVAAGGGWTLHEQVRTNADGRAGTAWYMGPSPGPQRLRAAITTRAIEFTATAEALEPGRTYFGANQYIEFIAGDLPVVLSAPHGGTLTPTEIPNRTFGTTVRDTNTEELARDIRSGFQSRAGASPFIIICRLHRTKLDANREIVEAAQGNAIAERAWREYHGFIEAARARVTDGWQHGFYIDLHGHGHEIQRIELGYMLTATDLGSSDAALAAAPMVQKSSLRALVQSSGRPHAELVRGPSSLGALLEAGGFPTVPSPADPAPGTDPYFSGGYNTGRHGRDADAMSGVQIEANFTGVRDGIANRTRFAGVLFHALDVFFDAYYGGPLAAVAAGAR